MNQKILDRMRRLCSMREYCVSDIRTKVCNAIAGKDGSGKMSPDFDREVEEIMQSLVSDRYIDDLRYASAFARDKSSISGWGAVKIRHALAAKGVGQDVICAALEEIDTARADMRLEKLMENKLRSLAGDPQCRLKMLRFGLGRGYGYNEVSRVIDVLLKRVSP